MTLMDSSKTFDARLPLSSVRNTLAVIPSGITELKAAPEVNENELNVMTSPGSDCPEVSSQIQRSLAAMSLRGTL